jgi:WhiB family redox-sensing transcriptional regulator
MSTDWTQAACDGQDPKYFFPRHGVKGQRHALTAMRICDACPIKRDCLNYAVDATVVTGGPQSQSEPPTALEGIWGGTTLKQRVALRRERSRGAT